MVIIIYELRPSVRTVTRVIFIKNSHSRHNNHILRETQSSLEVAGAESSDDERNSPAGNSHTFCIGSVASTDSSALLKNGGRPGKGANAMHTRRDFFKLAAAATG